MPLFYTAITSLDGYVADRSSSFAWSMPLAEESAADVSGAGPGSATQALRAGLVGAVPFVSPVVVGGGTAA